MIWLLILFAVFFPRPLFATDPIVKITNFSSNSSPEWVEIYNQSPNIIDLTSWSIGDSNITVLYDLPLTGCLAPNTYQTFFHASGWLNDGGDIIYLYDSQNNLIDTYPYEDGKLDLNYKTTNTCVPTSTPTPIPPTSTPTTPPLPTITPSPVPPTNTPAPTSTPQPTNTNTPTPTLPAKATATAGPTYELIPTSNPEPINEPTPTDEPQSAVLSAQNQYVPTPTPSPTLTPASKKISANLIATVFIGLGSLLLFIPIILVKLKHVS